MLNIPFNSKKMVSIEKMVFSPSHLGKNPFFLRFANSFLKEC